MKSKKILAFVLAMLMIIGITACGHSTTSSTSAPASSGASGTAGNESKSGSTAVPATTKFTVWSRDTEDSVVGRAFKSDIAAFSAEHPDLEIDYMSIPHGDVVTKWNTAFAAGTAPDVIDVGVSHIIQRVELGTIIPLDEYYATWDKKDDVASGMVDYGRYDDKIYAIAYNASPPIMAWRKDYFEEAGLDPEKPPKDWAEMLQYAEKLVQKDGNKVIRGAVELPATRGANYLFQFFLQKS